MGLLLPDLPNGDSICSSCTSFFSCPICCSRLDNQRGDAALLPGLVGVCSLDFLTSSASVSFSMINSRCSSPSDSTGLFSHNSALSAISLSTLSSSVITAAATTLSPLSLFLLALRGGGGGGIPAALPSALLTRREGRFLTISANSLRSLTSSRLFLMRAALSASSFLLCSSIFSNFARLALRRAACCATDTTSASTLFCATPRFLPFLEVGISGLGLIRSFSRLPLLGVPPTFCALISSASTADFTSLFALFGVAGDLSLRRPCKKFSAAARSPLRMASCFSRIFFSFKRRMFSFLSASKLCRFSMAARRALRSRSF